MIRSLCLLLLAGAVLARPPKAPGYRRHTDLFLAIKGKRAELEAKEQFEKLSRIEKIVILFHRGTPSFGKLKLTGENVVKEVLAWDRLQVDGKTLDDDTRKVAANLLPAALARRFPLGAGVNKRERFAASKLLVKALTHKHFAVRQAAIECLKKLYNTGRFYQPDAPEKMRKSRQSGWEKFIKRQR